MDTKDDVNYNYHGTLGLVAQDDVSFLIHKDKSYGGSWKKGGGRSAWFMLRRKMDRMIQIMRAFVMPDDVNRASLETLEGYLAQAIRSEDIFEEIEAEPHGADGSVLAEVRDLRRYLLLVEAEMVTRGVVETPSLRARTGASVTPKVAPRAPYRGRASDDPDDEANHAKQDDGDQV